MQADGGVVLGSLLVVVEWDLVECFEGVLMDGSGLTVCA